LQDPRAAPGSACVIYSLLASCKLHRVNAFDYLGDVLTRVGSHPARAVLALSPKAWKQALQNVEASQPPSAAS
jgi:hypothetical protein